MKKSLLVILVLGATTDSAMAQPTVTMYGVVDVGVVRDSGTLGPALTRLHSGIASGSRVGFKGVEELGGGMSAFFDLQNGFQADTGSLGQGGLLFGRQAFVGIRGAFGSVKVGRQYTTIDDMHGAVDPFGNNYAGRLQNLFQQGYVARVDNDIMYSTPTVGGFDANLAYGFGEVAGDSSARRYIGGSAGYAAGPLWVRLAAQSSNNGTTANTVTGSARNTMLGAKYDFGVVRLHGAFAVSKTHASGVTSVDARDYMIGVTVPFAANSLMASYIRRDDHLAFNRDADQIAIGYNHMLSKRTTAYAAYARMNNKNGSRYLIGTATDTGSNDRGLNLGLRHVF